MNQTSGLWLVSRKLNVGMTHWRDGLNPLTYVNHEYAQFPEVFNTFWYFWIIFGTSSYKNSYNTLANSIHHVMHIAMTQQVRHFPPGLCKGILYSTLHFIKIPPAYIINKLHITYKWT